MGGISSRPPAELDISSAAFLAAGRDLGEVIAFLSGGARPDPETLSRLCLTMRLLRTFVLQEAEEQAGREAVAGAMLEAVVARMTRPVSLAPLPRGAGHAAA